MFLRRCPYDIFDEMHTKITNKEFKCKKYKYMHKNFNEKKINYNIPNMN